VSLTRRLLLALWAGLLVAVGGLVVPTLFAVLPDWPLAGFIAGELLRRTTLVSAAIAVVLVFLGGGRAPGESGLARRSGLVALPLAPAELLALSEYGARPLLEAARVAEGAGSRAFIAWHGIATLLYLIAALITVGLLVGELRPRA